jgi:outer membrane lipoprotein-sorting protein
MFQPKTLLAAGMLLSALLGTLLGTGAQAQTPDATELMKQAHLNMYYPGEDGSARVEMVITDKRGRTRSRKFVMLRRDWEEGGQQRYFVYFSEPNDVRRMTFMAWKNPAADDSRWIYIPALDLVKPISANDKKSSFVGSDFSYEDVSGRPWTDDEHTYQREEERDGHLAHVIESHPVKKDYFAKKITWIDKESSLILREEYYDSKDKLMKLFETLEIAEVDGYSTSVRRRMSTPRKNNVTEILFDDVAYDVGIDPGVFSERYLKSPPRKYIKN